MNSLKLKTKIGMFYFSVTVFSEPLPSSNLMIPVPTIVLVVGAVRTQVALISYIAGNLKVNLTCPPASVVALALRSAVTVPPFAVFIVAYNKTAALLTGTPTESTQLIVATQSVFFSQDVVVRANVEIKNPARMIAICFIINYIDISLTNIRKLF